MRISGTARALAIALTISACIWIFALAAATGERTGSWRAVVYGLASTVCHQRPERSFFVNGRQLPVCGRCAGLYVSGALAAVAAWLGARRSPRDSRKLLLLAALPTAVTVPVEWLGIWPLSNVVRAAAALPLGAAAGWTFIRSLRSEERSAARRK
jgi:uncharacterized membrane protein